MVKYSLAILFRHDATAVVVRCRGAVGELGSLSPAPDGAAVNVKAACEFALGDTALVEPLNFSPLRHSQGGLRVVLHVSPVFVSVAPPVGMLTYCSITANL